jgi:hypothetical protein
MSRAARSMRAARLRCFGVRVSSESSISQALRITASEVRSSWLMSAVKARSRSMKARMRSIWRSNTRASSPTSSRAKSSASGFIQSSVPRVRTFKARWATGAITPRASQKPPSAENRVAGGSDFGLRSRRAM